MAEPIRKKRALGIGVADRRAARASVAQIRDRIGKLHSEVALLGACPPNHPARQSDRTRRLAKEIAEATIQLSRATKQMPKPVRTHSIVVDVERSLADLAQRAAALGSHS